MSTDDPTGGARFPHIMAAAARAGAGRPEVPLPPGPALTCDWCKEPIKGPAVLVTCRDPEEFGRFTFHPEHEPYDLAPVLGPVSTWRRCAGCGRPVTAWNDSLAVIAESEARHLYCTAGCRTKARRERRLRPPPEPRACQSCGETFTPTRADARYCSGRCREAARRARLKEDHR